MQTKMIVKLLFLAGIAAFPHCDSDDTIVKSKETNFYVAGRHNNGTNMVPTYWKNGEAVELSDAEGAADAVAVVGENVFVVGYLEGSVKKKLWTNGVMTDFSVGPDGEFDTVIGMKVFGSDWYAVGYHSDAAGNRAAYWKNGAIHIIETEFDSYAYDIAVEGNDIYVAGKQNNANGLGTATYWKNDIDTQLTSTLSFAGGIILINGDVYVSGNVGGTVRAWKNGQSLTINDNADSYCSSMNLSVVNNNIYVSGYQSNGISSDAKYWKNGTQKVLPVPAAEDTRAYNIVTSGNDVYILGHALIEGNYRPLVWKNFELVPPFDGTEVSGAYGLFAVLK